MKIPWLMILRVKSTDVRFSFYIFLPLIYLLFLPLFILGIVIFAFIIVFKASKDTRKKTLAVLIYLPRLLTAARRTEIEVHSNESDIKILVK